MFSVQGGVGMGLQSSEAEEKSHRKSHSFARLIFSRRCTVPVIPWRGWFSGTSRCSIFESYMTQELAGATGHRHSC